MHHDDVCLPLSRHASSKSFSSTASERNNNNNNNNHNEEVGDEEGDQERAKDFLAIDLEEVD